MLLFLFHLNVAGQFCSGSLGSPIVNINFGSGTNPGSNLSTIVPGATTTYSYESNAFGTPPANVIVDGSYSIVNEVPSNGSWFAGATDHTGNPNGYMAFFNASPTPGNFYAQTITGLCPGTTYEFAAWFANVVNANILPGGIPPNITFQIVDPSNNIVLASSNTGDIPNTTSMVWRQYSLLFTIPSTISSVQLILTNNNIGGSAQPGNDLAMDDITFRPCGPKTVASFNNITPVVDSIGTCSNSFVQLYGSIVGSLSNPAYQWQISSNNGLSFTNISGANSQNYTLTGLTPGNYIIHLLSAETSNINSSTCRFISNDLKLTVTSCLSSTIINDYTPVISLSPCDNGLVVEDASKFHTGDTVLLIQMKGAIIDSANTSSFGTISNYRNAGNYEFNYIAAISSNHISLRNNLNRSYDLPDGKVQLIRVPYYQSYVVTDTLTCLPWDGKKGGVLVLNVKDTVNMQTDIDVTGKGFWGGKVTNTHLNSTNCFTNGYSFPDASVLAAPKGESIASISTNISSGKGPLASGGGGGLDHNSGGGGGGNGGQGGMGGYQWDNCGSAPFDNRGIGGNNLSYSNAGNKVFMGGGGGAGHCNEAQGINLNGGNGGGIIIVQAGTLIANNHRMNAGGAAAVECSSTNVSNCNDGSGGGGAGGSILLNVNNFPSILTAGVNGGKGASLYAYTTTSGRVGPGGGGAGGVIWTKQTSLPSNLVGTLTGGANGVIIADSNNPWGTTPGQTGITLTGLVVPIDSVIFKPNIDSVRIKDSITGCKSFDFKGFAFTNSHPISSWHWDFGDGTVANTQNTSHNFVTAANYTVKLTVTDINGCKDSTNIGVTTGGLNIDYYYQENICNPLSVQFFNTLSSGINISWDWGDGTFSNGVSNPTHIFTATGTYPVQLSLQVGTCRDTILKNIQVGATPFNIITTPDTTICSGKTANLLTIPSLGFCWTPVTYLNDPLSDHPVTATPLPIQYFFTAEIPGTNLVTNGDFSSGDIGFTSDYTTENPNINEGRYEVGNSPAAWNSAFNACSDHSSGSGKMLMVNGNGTANAIIWKETVSVTPQTNYTFSAWLTTLSVNNPASLSFSINGLDMGALIPPGSPGCNWKRYFTNWNSGNLTAATIAIINKNTGIGGNDFALDDISFSPVQIKRDSILISIDTPVLHTRTDTTVCKGIPVMLHTSGNGTNFTWSPANGLDNIFSANPMATPADTTQYFVTATTNHGCSIKDSVTISILASPVITMTNDTSVCPNQGVQLQAAGGISYSWTPAGTLNNASIPNPVASPTVSPTTYYLAVTGANQCISRDSVKISIIPNPVFTVSPNQSACRGTAATLTASGGNIYTWTPAFPLNNSTIPTPQATPDSTTIFTVVITESACNRSATLQTILHIDSVPVLALKKSNDLDCSKTSAQLQATGADTYVWSPNLGLSNDSIANPLAFYSITQTYLVLGTDSLTGCKGSDTITVFYNVPPGVTYKAPTAFSPNGDGVNDCFKVLYTGVFDYFELSIYNRWGNRVFFSTDPNECWDGTLNGYPLEMSNYVYMIKTRNPCGETVSKGNLVLIR